MNQKSDGFLKTRNPTMPLAESASGNFFASCNLDAQLWRQRLHEAIIATDAYGDCLRIGFGIYQARADGNAAPAHGLSMACHLGSQSTTRR